MATSSDIKNGAQVLFCLLLFGIWVIATATMRVLKWTLICLFILFLLGVIVHAKEAIQDIQPNRNAGWYQVSN